MASEATTNAERLDPPSEGSESADDGFKDPKSIALNATVSNMSISPSNRDLVLAARNGLYVVDLENTRATPRFMPQGATWEVAEIQWNPHLSSEELICSAANQKLVIWNLRLRGPSSIQHVLHGHFRAVTDIHWHPQNENIVASTSIDGWTMIWDVRDRMKKDVMRMTTWEDAGTQVKWNMKEAHILASAHRGHVHIWDDRKGAIPLDTIYAHHSKIYGIDWSRTSASELVTCSLDSSIKRFSLSNTSRDPSDPDSLTPSLSTVQTQQPVWRARHLPFGHGVLALPHRGSYTLEMYRFDEPEEPVAAFERTALVKEYVWRTRGGADPSFDDREFQLVTLATDRTVKLEYISPSTVESTGWTRGSPIEVKLQRRPKDARSRTFRDPPAAGEGEENFLLLDDRLITAPTRRTVVGPNTKPADVLGPFQRYERAAQATASSSPDTGPVITTSSSLDMSSGSGSGMGTTPTQTLTLRHTAVTASAAIAASLSTTPQRTPLGPPPGMLTGKGGPVSFKQPQHPPKKRITMTLAPSRQAFATKRRGLDQVAWFSSVRLDRDREKSIQREEGLFDEDDDEEDDLVSQVEGENSESISRSRSRPTSRAPSQSGFSAGTGTDAGRSASRLRSSRPRITTSGGDRRSRSKSPLPEDDRELDPPQDLAEEVTRVVQRLSGSIQHEKTETTKSKKCTFTLHGPWGLHHESTFIRVTFYNFPSSYPRASSLLGKTRPSASIEKGSSDLPRGRRHALIRDLRRILEKEAPALELCLLYLLGQYTLPAPVPDPEPLPPPPGVNVWDDDDEAPLFPLGLPSENNLPVALLIDHYTLPRSRHTQGVFGANGQLVLLSRRAVKIVPESPRPPSLAESLSELPEIIPSTSGTLLDAMWGLSKLSTDAAYIKRDYVDIGRPRRANFTDGLIMKPYIRPATRDMRPPPPRTEIEIVPAFRFGGAVDPWLAKSYIVRRPVDPLSFCVDNAAIARDHGRDDHIEVWALLVSLLDKVFEALRGAKGVGQNETDTRGTQLEASVTGKARNNAQREFLRVFGVMYESFLAQKDLQMLAMLSLLLLNTETLLKTHVSSGHINSSGMAPPHPSQSGPHVRLQLDFHSHRLSPPAIFAPTPKQPATGGTTTPQPNRENASSPPTTPTSGPSSSKASWSSLLSAASYRNLLGGGGSSGSGASRRSKGEGNNLSSDGRRTSTIDELALANGSISPEVAAAIADIRRRRTVRPEPKVSSTTTGSLPRTETAPSGSMGIASGHLKARSDSLHSVSSAGAPPSSQPVGIRASNAGGINVAHFHKRLSSMNSQSAGSGGSPYVTQIRPARIQASFVDVPNKELPSMTLQLRTQLETHIRAYAEALRQLGLMRQRAEILKSSRMLDSEREETLALVSLCRACGRHSHARGVKCRVMKTIGGTVEPRCTVCHLPVKRLGRTCLRCMHITHDSCLTRLPQAIRANCPSGCGCRCSELGGSFIPRPENVHHSNRPSLRASASNSSRR